eukprot:scaffold34821_cov206-Amphora_coffeaeformis.AAC.1
MSCLKAERCRLLCGIRKLSFVVISFIGFIAILSIRDEQRMVSATLRAPMGWLSLTLHTDNDLNNIDSTSTEESSWWWTDVVEEERRCGASKCFFPSQRNTSIGYLIMDANRHYDSVEQATQFAFLLERKYQSRHFYMEPPVMYNITHCWEFMARQMLPYRIVKMLYPSLAFYYENQDQNTPHDDKYNNAHVINDIPDLSCLMAVQKVRKAPQPSFFLAVDKVNRNISLTEALAFRPHIANATAFWYTWENEIARLERILTRYFDVLQRDFQGLVDSDGRFYHMDLDQGFLKKPPHRGQPSRKIAAMIQTLHYIGKVAVTGTL